MTRENKAGLVVASSFLILVGVVVAMKLRDPGEAPAPEVTPAMSVPTREKGPAVAAAPEPTKEAEPPSNKKQPPPPEEASGPLPPLPGEGAGTSRGGAVIAPPPAPLASPPDDKTEKKEVAPPPTRDEGDKNGGDAPPHPPEIRPDNPAPTERTIDHVPLPLQESPRPKPADDKPVESHDQPEAPPPPRGETTTGGDKKTGEGQDKAPPTGSKEESKPLDPPPPVGETPPSPSPDKKAEKKEGKPPLLPAKADEEGPPAVLPPPPDDSPPAGEQKRGVEVLPPAPPPAKDEKPEKKGPVKDDSQPPVKPAADERPVSPPAVPPTTTSSGRPLERSEFIPRAPAGDRPQLGAPVAKTGGEGGSNVRQASAEAPALPPEGGQPGPLSPEVKKSDDKPAEDSGAGSEAGAPPAGETKPPARVESVTVPATGGAPRPRTGPIAASPPRTGPAAGATATRSDSYRVEQYRAVQGDTWESLSRRYYGSERAAAALQAFNKACLLASQRLQRTGTLVAGEPYFIPALEVLVRQHKLQLDAPPAP